MNKLYDKRSRYVHQGQGVSETDVETVEQLCVEVLYCLLRMYQVAIVGAGCYREMAKGPRLPATANRIRQTPVARGVSTERNSVGAGCRVAELWCAGTVPLPQAQAGAVPPHIRGVSNVATDRCLKAAATVLQALGSSCCWVSRSMLLTCGMAPQSRLPTRSLGRTDEPSDLFILPSRDALVRYSDPRQGSDEIVRFHLRGVVATHYFGQVLECDGE